MAVFQDNIFYYMKLLYSLNDMIFFFLLPHVSLFTLSHSTSPFFVKVFFETAFHELFVGAGFKL
jgi:hypothetical protein